MHAYHATKTKFIEDVNTGQIGELVLAGYTHNFGRGTGKSEITARQESLVHLANVLDAQTIPGDLEIVIEYKLAPTGKRGGNQVREIMTASKFTVFFIDEAQTVTWDDFGSIAEIERCAALLGATVHHAQLNSQFRCNGSDDFLTWLDDTLQIKATPGATFDRTQFDFRVVDTPQELVELIEARNTHNRARIVAGRCWPWTEYDPTVKDIVIPEHNFAMRWNLVSERNLWIVSPTSVTDAGCIHSAQGLELDYVGVIIGPDLTVRDGQVQVHPEARVGGDSALKGYKTALKRNPAAAKAKAASIIKNTYRTLLTRGLKGCYVFCVDRGMSDLFKGGKLEKTEEKGTIRPYENRPKNGRRLRRTGGN